MKDKKSIFKNPILRVIYKIVSNTLLIALLLIAAFLLYYVVSAKIYESKGEKFEPLFSMYTIISPSMTPNINVYDVVFDKKVKADEVKEGDVITFISTSSLSEGTTITHRVVGVVETEGGRKFRTKGDYNLVADSSLVDEQHLIGKVLFKIPQLGRVQFMLQSKGGWLFALLIPALIVVIFDIIKVLRLSTVKEAIDESLKEPEKDPEIERKQRKLKEELQQKRKETENKKKDELNKYNLDMDQIIKNIKDFNDENKK